MLRRMSWLEVGTQGVGAGAGTGQTGKEAARDTASWGTAGCLAGGVAEGPGLERQPQSHVLKGGLGCDSNKISKGRGLKSQPPMG